MIDGASLLVRLGELGVCIFLHLDADTDADADAGGGLLGGPGVVLPHHLHPSVAHIVEPSSSWRRLFLHCSQLSSPPPPFPYQFYDPYRPPR